MYCSPGLVLTSDPAVCRVCVRFTGQDIERTATSGANFRENPLGDKEIGGQGEERSLGGVAGSRSADAGVGRVLWDLFRFIRL
jgi:hypothetical protein